MVGPSVGIFLGGSTEWLKLSHPPLLARETGLNTNRKTGKGTNEKMRKLWKKKQGGAAVRCRSRFTGGRQAVQIAGGADGAHHAIAVDPSLLELTLPLTCLSSRFLRLWKALSGGGAGRLKRSCALSRKRVSQVAASRLWHVLPQKWASSCVPKEDNYIAGVWRMR